MASQLFLGTRIAYIENATAPAADNFTLVGPAAAPLLQLGAAIRAFEAIGIIRLSIIHWSISFQHHLRVKLFAHEPILTVETSQARVTPWVMGLKMRTLKHIALIGLLLFIATMAGLYCGYRRGYNLGEKITNKWWIDQQSQYYDASEVIKKRRAMNLDII